MTCEISNAQLWSWVDRDADELEAHLEHCASCRERAEAIRADIGCVATDPSVLELPLPDRVGPYAIQRLLGEGGQALVYEAEQPELGRSVALKVLKGGRFVGATQVRQFRREIRTLAALEHPFIATIFEAGRTEDGQHYLSMERVDGILLSEIIADAGTSSLEVAATRAERLALFIRICEAIQHAHDHGVVHRDLKPSNIMVQPTGTPKVLDFGLARLTRPEAGSGTLTESGRVEGTPRYMSPEQAQGRRAAVGPASDVYSLGVILYELLTGSLPYATEGSIAEMLDAILRDPPRRPSNLDPSLHGDLETILLKALEKEPALRYPSARAFSDDLKRFALGDPIEARRPRWPRARIRKAIRRRAARLGRRGAWIAAGALALTAFVWLGNLPDGDPQRARRELLGLRVALFDPTPDGLSLSRSLEAERHYPNLSEAALVTAIGFCASRKIREAVEILERQATHAPDPSAFKALLHEIRHDQEGGSLPEFVSTVAPPTEDGESERWYLRSFATFDPMRALQYAHRAVRADSSNLLALEFLARLSEREGDLETALSSVTRLIALETPVAGWRRHRSELLVRLGRYREAEAELTALIELAPDNPIAYSLRGLVHRHLREYEPAVEDFTHAIAAARSTRESSWYFYHRGTPNWILGRTEAAAEDFRAAHEALLHATFADARLFLTLRELGRDEDAAMALAEARANRWNDPWLSSVFQCLAGEIEPGALAARADSSRPAQLCEANYYAGEASLLSGDRDQALRWFRACIRTGIHRDPDANLDPMSEYELAEWRLADFATDGQADAPPEGSDDPLGRSTAPTGRSSVAALALETTPIER